MIELIIIINSQHSGTWLWQWQAITDGIIWGCFTSYLLSSLTEVVAMLCHMAKWWIVQPLIAKSYMYWIVLANRVYFTQLGKRNEYCKSLVSVHSKRNTTSDERRMLGGIISGGSLAGGSMPFSFCWMRYIARANWSLVNFPILRVSHNALAQTAFCLHY